MAIVLSSDTMLTIMSFLKRTNAAVATATTTITRPAVKNTRAGGPRLRAMAPATAESMLSANVTMKASSGRMKVEDQGEGHRTTLRAGKLTTQATRRRTAEAAHALNMALRSMGVVALRSMELAEGLQSTLRVVALRNTKAGVHMAAQSTPRERAAHSTRAEATVGEATAAPSTLRAGIARSRAAVVATAALNTPQKDVVLSTQAVPGSTADSALTPQAAASIAVELASSIRPRTAPRAKGAIRRALVLRLGEIRATGVRAPATAARSSSMAPPPLTTKRAIAGAAAMAPSLRAAPVVSSMAASQEPSSTVASQAGSSTAGVSLVVNSMEQASLAARSTARSHTRAHRVKGTRTVRPRVRSDMVQC